MQIKAQRSDLALLLVILALCIGFNMIRIAVFLWYFVFSPAAPAGDTKTYTRAEIEKKGSLILVNKDNLLPSGYIPPNLQWANTIVTCEFSNMRLDAHALKALKKMFEAAKKDEIDLVFFGGWRSEAAQTKFFAKKVSQVGYKAAVIAVSPPRASEHELGLAADILSTKHNIRDANFGTTSTGKWLAANAWKYGFILRYPKSKVSITGYKYEPWHYRFVGEVHARKITENGLCLEEYLENPNRS